MKVLFVSYGGGHVEMCLPVMRALRALVPGCEARILALTTAAGVARRAGEQPLGLRDFCRGAEGERALRYGERLIGDQQHPDVGREESLAYLGLNFLEWVQALGEDAAWQRWREAGRQGFRPVNLMRRILAELKPDVVVATNSPRSEQAAIEAAQALGIPTLSMVDLFALPGDPYLARTVHADRIAVLSDATRDNLVDAGVAPQRIAVTGNPAFDGLAGAEARVAAQHFRAERGWGERPVVLWAGHLEPGDADPRWAGAALGDAVLQALAGWALAREDACLAVRYHPNEWHRFRQPAPHPRLHWSQPDRETLLPVLAAADVVVVQATTVGAQAHAAGKQVLSLAFSPLVQRSGMDYARLGLATAAQDLADLPALLAQGLAAVRRDAPAAGPQGSAAQRVAREIQRLAGAPAARTPRMKAPRILGLILARGGSKRLPGKNIRPLAGKPLVAWSIEAARACAAIEEVVVSTDDTAIADVARQYGARVPFLRPPALAGDTSTSADAALHALAYLRDQEGRSFDAVILLEPTSPLRASRDLPAVAELLARRWDETDAVVSVGRVQLEQPAVMKRMDADGRLGPWVPPAALEPGKPPAAWFPYGVAYAVKTEALERWRTFYPPRVLGYTIERWQNYEVDDLFDFLCVEAVMQHFKGRLP